MTISLAERKLSPHKITPHPQTRHVRQPLGLRTKATLLSAALGALSILAVGGVAHTVVRRSVTEQISQAQLVRTELVADQFHQFLQARYNEIQLLANHQIFVDSDLRTKTPLAQKQAVLDTFKDQLGFYDSIIFFDVQGDPLFQAESGPPFQGNYRDRPYFQAAINTQQITMNGPGLSKSAGELRIEYAAPVQDATTGEVVGVLRLRIPADSMQEFFQIYAAHGDEWTLFNAEGDIFAGGANVAQSIDAFFPQLSEQRQLKHPAVRVLANSLEENQKELVSYVPVKPVNGLPDPQIGAMIATDTALSFAAERHLLLTLVWGTGAAAIAVGGAAAFMANRAIRPILAATQAVQKIGQGELDTQVNIPGQDELAVLGANINTMAGQIKGRVQEHVLTTEKAQLLAKISTAQAWDMETLERIFEQSLQEVRGILNTDRIVLYRLNPDLSGSIVAESVASGWLGSLMDNPEEAGILAELLKAYLDEPVTTTIGVLQARFNPHHQQLMKQLQIKSSLVLSVLNRGNLAALLVAHHCAKPHSWRSDEINFLTQVSTQLGLALDRVLFIYQTQVARQKAEDLAAMQHQLNAKLEQRSLELLNQI